MLAVGSCSASRSRIAPARAGYAVGRPPIAIVWRVTASFTPGSGRNDGAGDGAACALAAAAWLQASASAARAETMSERTSAARRFAVETDEVGFERAPRLVVEIDHVSRRIEAVLDVRAQRGIEAEVLQRVLGAEERRREIVVAVRGEDAQVRILRHRLTQVGGAARRRDRARAAVVPIAADDGVVRAEVRTVDLESQLVAHVAAERTDERVGQQVVAGRIVRRRVVRAVERRTAVAAVEAAGHDPGVAEQRLLETARGDAQGCALAVRFVESGVG